MLPYRWTYRRCACPIGPELIAAAANVPRREPSAGRTDEAPDQFGDPIGTRLQCEMTGVENANVSARHIPAIGFRLRAVEREIILTPDHQQARLLLAHPRLPPGVVVDVRAVVSGPWSPPTSPLRR